MQGTIKKTGTTLGRALLVAQRDAALKARTAAEQKIIALNKATPIDFAKLKVQQDVCEWQDRQVKSLNFQLGKK